MRVLETYPHTSDQGGNEAEKEHQKQGEQWRPTRKGMEKKNVDENHRYITSREGWGGG